MIKFCKVLVTPLGVELDMMNNNKLRFTFFLAAILAASFACNFPGVSSPATAPTAPVPVSSEAVQELEENLRSAAATAASGGVVNLVITEAQLTSLASLELQAIQDPKIENIQIRLRDGQILTTAKVTVNGVALNLSLTSSVYIGADGIPKSQTVAAKLGPLPLPDNIVDLFTQEIDNLLAEQMIYDGRRVIVQSLDIADGSMTIMGYLE